jgi:hypothetical protein
MVAAMPQSANTRALPPLLCVRTVVMRRCGCRGAQVKSPLSLAALAPGPRTATRRSRSSRRQRELH